MNAFEDVVTQWLLIEASRFVLVSTRIAAMMAVVPMPWARAPLRVRAGLVMVITFAVFDRAAVPAETSVITWSVLLLGEAVIGAAIGFVVRLFLSAPEVMGGAISPNIGLGMAQVFDPTQAAPEPILSKIFVLLAILLSLSIGVHRWLIGSVIRSFDLVPIGAPLNLAESSSVLLNLFVGAFELGVRLSLPLLAILFVVQLALAFISRAAPAMQIFSVGFAVTLLVGFGTLILTLPDTAHWLIAATSDFGSHAAQLLDALAK